LSLDVGGLERGLINQIREGLKLGERISVICLERLGALAPHLDEMGVQVFCLDKQPGLRLGLIGRMRQLFQRLRPNVVHSHQIGGLLYAGPAALSAGVPLTVHTEHGRENYDGSMRRRWLGRLSGLQAKRIFCLSEDMAAALHRNRIVSPKKVAVVPNGIDTGRFQSRNQGPALRARLGIPPMAPVVGTVARLTEVKRQDVLLRGFARLKLAVPDAHLVVVGDGPLMDSLRQLAAHLGVASSVHFTGHQTEPETFYDVMDIFALSSRSEGMPQTIMEAFAAEVPVVASRVGGVPEMVEDGVSGLLFPDGGETALAQSLTKLIGNPDLGRQIRVAAKKRVEEQFDVRRMAADYHRHFLQLLNSRS
jgi:sugar transferase (PEP-CTERM/EpsH1 system associated)